MALPPTFDVRLASANMLSSAVRELTFERTDGAPVPFEAGQWISLNLPLPNGEAKRAYSIASPPNGTSSFQIAVTRVAGGAGSGFLHELGIGQIVRATGPQGFFTRPFAARGPSLFIGTGTGITPLRSMIVDALRSGDPSPMILLAGVREPGDQLYAEEFHALAKAHPNFHAEYTLSKPDMQWSGRTGYVQTHVAELWQELTTISGQVPHAYICGLEKMVSAVRELLRKEMGVERKHVHSERYD